MKLNEENFIEVTIKHYLQKNQPLSTLEKGIASARQSKPTVVLALSRGYIIRSRVTRLLMHHIRITRKDTMRKSALSLSFTKSGTLQHTKSQNMDIETHRLFWPYWITGKAITEKFDFFSE